MPPEGIPLGGRKGKNPKGEKEKMIIKYLQTEDGVCIPFFNEKTKFWVEGDLFSFRDDEGTILFGTLIRIDEDTITIQI
jgi:hypothetical protein